MPSTTVLADELEIPVGRVHALIEDNGLTMNRVAGIYFVMPGVAETVRELVEASIRTCAEQVYGGSLESPPEYCDELAEDDSDYCPAHNPDRFEPDPDAQRDREQEDAWLREDDDNARGDDY